MIIRLVLSLLISMFIALFTAVILIPRLRRMKSGQMIREDGPVWHSKKQGTPIMGGIIFITGTLIACLITSFGEMKSGEYKHLYVMIVSLLFALIGFFDDYKKLVKKQNLGLTAIQKFLLQILVAAAFVVFMRLKGHLSTELYVPFFNTSFNLPDPFYSILMVFIAVGTVNAVNITDGVDGLATGVTIPIMFCLMDIAAVWKNISIGTFSVALAGALIVFLLFNYHPAKIFMGDTGSLFLGGAVFSLAFVMDIPLILIPLGIVYIVEIMSDVIQITYFKMTKGKRIFKMAPLHHHLEMCGWSEQKLFFTFTAVSAVFSVISYVGVAGRKF